MTRIGERAMNRTTTNRRATPLTSLIRGEGERAMNRTTTNRRGIGLGCYTHVLNAVQPNLRLNWGIWGIGVRAYKNSGQRSAVRKIDHKLTVYGTEDNCLKRDLRDL